MPVNWHVAAAGADTNSGSSVAVKFSGSTASIVGATVTIAGDVTGGVVANSDAIRLAGGTNGRYSTDIYVITGISYGGGNTTVTVDASPNSPSVTGYTIGGAFATRQRALDLVADSGSEEVRLCGNLTVSGAGDTGIIKRGAIDDGSAIRLIGCDANGAILAAGTVTLDLAGYSVHGFTDNNAVRAGYTFTRLRVVNGSASAYGFYSQNSSSYRWVVDTCSGESMLARAVNLMGYGAIVTGGTYVNCYEPIAARGWISGVTCLDCSGGNAAITLVISIAGSGVADCLIDRCRFGIYLSYGSAGYWSGAAIARCTIVRSTNHAIWANAKATFLVERCVLALSGGYGISCLSGAPVAYRRDCLFWQNASGDVNSALRGDDVGSVNAPPEFVSEGRRDFRPRHGSPLVLPDGSYIGSVPPSRLRRRMVRLEHVHT